MFFQRTPEATYCMKALWLQVRVHVDVTCGGVSVDPKYKLSKKKGTFEGKFNEWRFDDLYQPYKCMNVISNFYQTMTEFNRPTCTVLTNPS